MTSLRITQETFQDVEEEWNSLLPLSPSNTIFATPAWQQLWWEEFGEGRELLLYGIRRDGQLIGLAPLMRADGQLSFVGGANVCDYMDFIIRKGDEKEAFDCIASQVGAMEWESISLRSVVAHSPTRAYLPEALERHGLTAEIRPEEVCPKIELPATWDDYLSSLNKKDRHELRRKMRRLYGAGDARYHVSQESDAISGDLEDFLQLLVGSRVDKAQFMTPEIRGFFQSAITRMAELGYVKLVFLELDGQRVSSAICFDYNDSFFLYNSGYDTSFSSLSVGILLKAFCLKEAIARGRRQFDFLRGSENYKYHLGAVDEPVYTISVSR